MDSVMKKSLGAPIRQFTRCVSGAKDSLRGSKKSQGRRKSAPHISLPTQDSSWLRAYQADLQKERKQREAKFAQKNAERAAMRTYYRSQHRRLSKTSIDSKKHQKRSGRKSSLPPSLASLLRPKAASKDDGLFGAFQGLSLSNVGGVKGGGQSAAIGINGEQCKVM